MSTTKPMDADEVRNYVAAKWPSALKSPVAVAFRDASDEMRRDAQKHAENCLSARDGWDVETLSFNIESSFPELDADECDEIARLAIASQS